MKRIDLIKALLENAKQLLEKCPFKLLTKNDFEIDTSDFYKLWDLMNEFDSIVGKKRPNFSTEESKLLNEIGQIISKILETIDFSPAKNDSLIIPFMNEIFQCLEENDTVQKMAIETLTFILDENFHDYKYLDEWYDTAFLIHAYVYANILIERKELTKELYDLLFPYLYRQKDELKHEVRNLIPVIPLSRYKNDYDWLRDIDEEAEALIHVASGDLSTDVIFALYDGVKLDKRDDDRDDGDSPTPELVKA